MHSPVNAARQPFSRIVVGLALTAGVAALLDGLDAVVYYWLATGTTAMRLFQGIAGAAVLGPRAFSMGSAPVAVGVAIHCAIAATATVIFYFLATQMRFLVRKPWLWGPIFGLGLYLVMHYMVVIPHSRLPRTSHAAFWRSELADQLFSHAIFVGLTIALGVRRVLRMPD
jgi:hypothetical protein